MCNRPYKDEEDMREGLIERHNSVVKPNDEVYMLGDVTFENRAKAEETISRLNGKKNLIVGDHDTQTLKCKHLFESIHYILELKINKKSIVMCHWPFRFWPKSHWNSWHLFGHVHGNYDGKDKSWDVGVDNNNYRPISFDEVKEIMDGRPDNKNLIKPLRALSRRNCRRPG